MSSKRMSGAPQTSAPRATTSAAASGASSSHHMDERLAQLNRQFNGRSSNSMGAATASPSPPPAAATSSSSAAQPLSAAASSLLHDIDSFDLFAENKARVAPRSATRRPASGLPAREAASDSAATSCGIGSDDPIPVDAPPMSDGVMMHGGGASSSPPNDAEEAYGSKVIPVVGGKASSLLNGSKIFLASLRRSTQSLYFEELQYQCAGGNNS